MARVSPTRIYLRRSDDSYSRFLWFQNNRENEMLIGVYGLDGTSATLAYTYPERVLSAADLSNVRFKSSEMKAVGEKLDHITCHANGTFHIKLQRGGEIYVDTMRRVEPLTPITSTFLVFRAISDVVEKYRAVKGPLKEPHQSVEVPSASIINMEAAFAGAQHGLLEEVLERLVKRASGKPGVQPGVELQSGTLRGALWWHFETLAHAVAEIRPRGTFLSFQFPVAEDRWLIKGFMFA